MPETQAILTDIEGTTSSIDFVHKVLFPYARQHLSAFVRAHAYDPKVRQCLRDAAREAGCVGADDDTIVDQLIEWIDADRKSTPLKSLQGMIWKEGYASGAYRAHVYPEVPAQLQRWHDAGIHLYVYSSGSVTAQKLLFGHTEAGDLTPLFSGYFDTRTGAKREAASYARIAAEIDEKPEHILFLSDVDAELDAAHASGLRTTLVCRAPDTCPADATHPCVPDFDQVII